MTKVYSQQSVLTGRKRKMSVEMGHFAVVDPLHRWFLYTSNYGINKTIFEISRMFEK